MKTEWIDVEGKKVKITYKEKEREDIKEVTEDIQKD